MKSWTMGYVGDGWQEQEEDEQDCTHCQYWDGHSGECRNPESEYYESTMQSEEGCDAFGEWKPWPEPPKEEEHESLERNRP